MSNLKEDVKFSLKVMINKERNKVLFAEADCHFADILLSFLTLPLGRIIKVLNNHYRDEAPKVGSLSSLYRSLANLESSHFWTEGAKQTLLNPTSSFEDAYERLKLDIYDSPPAEYFMACHSHDVFRSASVYYDNLKPSSCKWFQKFVIPKGARGGSSDGVLIMRKASFTISDDLQIFPNEIGLVGIINHEAEEIKVDLRFNEIMKLLKASLTSPTPLSDLILKKTTQTNSLKIPLDEILKVEKPNSGSLSLKVVTQKSSGKLLYAQAKEDFVEFLFSFFHIPIGGAEHLLAGKTCVKAIDNLYRSTTDLIDCKYFKTPDTKKRLMNPNLPHGCISKNHILPLTEEGLPADYIINRPMFSFDKFPKGKGSYLEGPTTYKVTDDLTVTPLAPSFPVSIA